MLMTFYSAYEIYEYNEQKSFFIVFVTIMLIFLVITQLIRMNQNIYRYFNRMEHGLEQNKCFTLFSSPDPIAIIDNGGRIVWYNQTFFEQISNNADAFGFDICSELGIKQTDLSDGNEFIFEYQDIKYKTKCIENGNYNVVLRILFFRDVTELINITEEYHNKKPTVAIIAIDNYEDVFQNVKESERSRVQSAIENVLENLTAHSNSFLKRVSKDRFLVVFEEQHLSKIIADRFKILDEARSINVNEEICVTLSIGVGRCSNSLAESELFARQSLDMALGRGGDQAAVKTENGFEFFGGMSKGVEKHSRIKTRLISNTMQKLFEGASNIIIMGHKFGDLDSVGSAIGLSAAINSTGKQSYVLVDPNKNLAKSLIENVKKRCSSIKFIDEPQAVAMIDSWTLLVIVDTHKSDLVDSSVVYEKVKNVIIIDHHRKNVNYIENALLFYHDPHASSAAEMIAEVIPYFKDLGKIPCCAADALLAGITLDTKNFIVKTSVRTFESAAYLKKQGADTIAVRELFSNSFELYKLKSEIVSSAELYDNYAISIVHDGIANVADTRIIAPQAADELLGISSVSAAFVIYRTNDIMNISARSYGSINVQLVMEKIGGGGHQTMAAAQLSNVSVEEAKKLLIDAIEVYKNENHSFRQKENQ